MTEDALVRAYRPMAEAIAREFFVPGADDDDVAQEALIGLLEAIRGYRPGLGVPFKPFANMVIRRALISAVIAARRGKHLALTQAMRDGRTEEGDIAMIVDLLPSHAGDPQATLELRQDIAALCAGFQRLSALEREAILRIVNGVSYAGEKRIDNAALRARAKLREAA